MQFLNRAALALAFALPLSAVPVAAQHYKWDFTILGGYSWLNGNILDRADFDFIDGEIIDGDLDRENFGLGSGGTVGTQLGYWFNRRFGLRLNGAYTASDISRTRLFFNDPVIIDPLFRPFDHDVNVWNLTGDLMVRFNTPRTRWDGFEFLPFLAVGLGATWLNPAGNEFNVVNEFPIVDPFDPLLDGDIGDGIDAIPLRCSTIILARCAVLEKNTSFTGLIGLGMDLRFSPKFGARLEFGDRIWGVSVKEVAFDPDFPFIFREIGDLGKTVNQLYLTIGGSFLFGLQYPPARAVVAPPPRPAPPPPSTEEITVCIVDPMYAQGLRTITATRNLSTGDTTVVKNGDRMPLSQLVANVPVASNSSWYISGAPLEIGMAPNKIQYVSVGGARHIEAGELAYIGTVNSIPVFADRLTLAPGLANLGPNTDLNQLTTASPDARKALETVAVIYVPLQPTGCVFQALQKQQEIRKK